MTEPRDNQKVLGDFNAEVKLLLLPNSSPGRSLLWFIRRSLAQFHLDGRCDECEIFNEAYQRGVKKIESGESIRNPAAWLRVTSYHVIQEKGRLRKRETCLERLVEQGKAIPTSSDEPIVDDKTIDRNITAVIEALKNLKTIDRAIVYLHVCENLSWKEVSDRLIGHGFPPMKETALRQRKVAPYADCASNSTTKN